MVKCDLENVYNLKIINLERTGQIITPVKKNLLLYNFIMLIYEYVYIQRIL